MYINPPIQTINFHTENWAYYRQMAAQNENMTADRCEAVDIVDTSCPLSISVHSMNLMEVRNVRLLCNVLRRGVMGVMGNRWGKLHSNRTLAQLITRVYCERFSLIGIHCSKCSHISFLVCSTNVFASPVNVNVFVSCSSFVKFSPHVFRRFWPHFCLLFLYVNEASPM
jgi:hypothetical protein